MRIIVGNGWEEIKRVEARCRLKAVNIGTIDNEMMKGFAKAS